MMRASDPDGAAQFDAQMQAMKMQVGADMGEILGMLAGDFYYFIDVVEKEREIQDWVYDEETDDWEIVTEKKVLPTPKVTMLWGLQDPASAAEKINALFVGLSANLPFSQMIKKRTYQETDVYCIGMGVADEGAYPDGSSAFAMFIVDRYLSIGSWEYATGVIRRMKSDAMEVDERLQAIVDANRDSNLLVMVPSGYQQRMQKMIEKVQGEETVGLDRLLEELESADFELPDQDLERRMKERLKSLILCAKELSEKAEALVQDVVVTGTHKDTSYELRMASEVRK